MKVTQGQMVKAYVPLADLKGQRMSSPAKAIAIWNLWKAAESAMDFQIAEEQKMIENCHAEVLGKGRLMFKSPEDEQGYKDAWAELAGLELDVDVKPVILNADDSISISGEGIQALKGLVNFE